MIYTGVVSVTFRTLPAAEVIKVASQAQTEGIEWSGEPHAPAGKIPVAKQVGQMTRDAGLQVAAYGSYYRVGCEKAGTTPFKAILDTAAALGAPTIRVWAGDCGSKTAREHVWRKVVSETQRLAEMARPAGISLSFEFQANTLNDTGESSQRLMQTVARDNVFTYWQPDGRLLQDEQLAGLADIRDWLSNVHVFYWQKGRRMPLSEGDGDWKPYLALIARSKRDHMALIEFVQDDLPSKFLADAAALKEMIHNLPSH